MELSFPNTVTLSALEDGGAIKIPSDILNIAGFIPGDILRFEIAKEKIVISRNDVLQKETLESLFNNYEGLPFKTNLVDLGDPRNRA